MNVTNTYTDTLSEQPFLRSSRHLDGYHLRDPLLNHSSLARCTAYSSDNCVGGYGLLSMDDSVGNSDHYVAHLERVSPRPGQMGD